MALAMPTNTSWGVSQNAEILTAAPCANNARLQVVFKTRIFHCNVDTAGNLGLEMLKDGWGPALTISKVLHATGYILMNPDPHNPVVAE
ncbi:constitutive photomorphogenesis protein 10-like [Impatiens glandulifera]|uniref:constitutive photomorphogenesis protein 10-like n=1 Tax=Impatiens glandulifera TaxID=253017 RepID=UPI001FB05B62|nr:constitutive photomorphogenesis protein 10-like [Impatiens glandulifera]